MAQSVKRWEIRDTKTGETYLFPMNPNKMTSPHAPRKTTVFARSGGAMPGYLYSGGRFANHAVARVMQYRQEPYTWQFSGRIITLQQYEDFLDWTGRVARLEISDHLGRTFSVRMDSFELSEKKPTPRRPYRFEYTVTALIYGQVS